MTNDIDPVQPPLLTSQPGIGGRIKAEIDDFQVEEIPAYAPSGEGEFLYLWLEKRDLGAEYFQRQIAKRLDLAPGDIGSAGLKDRRAVTRQWISVPKFAEPNLPHLEGDGIRVLETSRHGNKLKLGHLHGNRFRILIRDSVGDPAPILDAIAQFGLPNYYGPQRFGNDGETLALGWQLLRGEPTPRHSPFLHKLALSAVQSALFNLLLGQRLREGTWRTVLPGDVLAKIPFGGMFVSEDPAAEQVRLDAREIVSAGPIFGKKMFPAKDVVSQREEALLAEHQLSRASFANFGKLMLGTRRHNLIYVNDLKCEPEPAGLWLSFSMPAGSYATVLLREIMKTALEGVQEG